MKLVDAFRFNEPQLTSATFLSLAMWGAAAFHWEGLVFGVLFWFGVAWIANIVLGPPQ